MKSDSGHLLVVDDNEMNRDMLSRRLKRRGLTVAVAEDGPRALQMIEAETFDLILLDIMMPGVNGLEVLKTIRGTHSIADLPVIMVTAKDQSEDIVGALKLGANDYVTKPLDFHVVYARVQTQLSLKRLAQLKNEFVRIASHDLKNPLTSIMAIASLLVSKIPAGATMTPEMFDLAVRIRKNTAVMQRIIEDFLDFQAMEDGQLKIERRPVDVNDLAREVVEGNVAYAERKGISLALELEANLPRVDADGRRITQVLQNFIGNAIKFGPNGTDVVVGTCEDRGTALVEVRDSGPGLSDDDLKRVFTKYARLSNKPTGVEKSSGLGLAICKQLIDLHGGTIGVRNNPEHGATFWFGLPLT